MCPHTRSLVQPTKHTTSYVLSEPRKKLAAAAEGSIIGFATGYSDLKPTGQGYSNAYDLFDTSTQTWTSGKLPSGQGRQYGTAVGCGGRLLFGGGQIGGGRSNVVDIYNTITQKWSNSTLSVARSNLAAACAKNRYAVFAGGQIPGRNTVDVYDTVANTWGLLDPLNYGRGWIVGSSAGACTSRFAVLVCVGMILQCRAVLCRAMLCRAAFRRTICVVILLAAVPNYKGAVCTCAHVWCRVIR